MHWILPKFVSKAKCHVIWLTYLLLSTKRIRRQRHKAVQVIARSKVPESLMQVQYDLLYLRQLSRQYTLGKKLRMEYWEWAVQEGNQVKNIHRLVLMHWYHEIRNFLIRGDYMLVVNEELVAGSDDEVATPKPSTVTDGVRGCIMD